MILLACGLWVLVQWASSFGYQTWVPMAEYGTLTDCQVARDQAAGGQGAWHRWRCVAKEQVK